MESTVKHLLVIDDEPGHRLMIRAVMEDAGWRVTEAASGEEGVALFSSTTEPVHVVLVDMNMPGMDGQATLARLHDIRGDLPVVLLTAYGTVGAAVEAMRNGAFDYLTKPADNDELILSLNRAYEYCCLAIENERLRAEISGEGTLATLVGSSAAMRQVHEFIRQAGPSEATVLITGESGTGKELIAQALHTVSARRKRALIKVNCAAIPAQLLESELFGYERGAFTGAVKDKPGRFQLASGGTLFLDEIGELPLDLQAKLLRVLQERVVEPLGGVKSRPVDVRILVATNKNLRQQVAAGLFREDLFFRLNVLEIESPPLRQRLDDLPQLVNHLLAGLAEKNKKNVRGVSPAFLHALSRYQWPGNVRELENVLERALILSRADILDVESLPAHIIAPQPQGMAPYGNYGQMPPAPPPAPAGAMGYRLEAGYGGAPNSPPASPPAYAPPPQLPVYPHNGAPAAVLPQNANGTGSGPLPLRNHAQGVPDAPLGNAPRPGVSPLEEAEKQALLQSLHENQGHREKTAAALGISRRTLQYKLKKFGLNRR